jgi:pyoverdine/dityrosine biosynthesis protein Dit1
MANLVVAQPVDGIVGQLLELVFRSRRLASDHDPCAEKPCPECFSWHWERTKNFIVKGQPVHFVLPAFPAKSRSPRKVLGPLPDLAEKVALGFLQSFCDQVSHFYQPGARITICSDGHVFSDVLGIPDEQVSAYREELQHLIRSTGGGSIDLYSLADAFGVCDFDQMRQLLNAHHAASIEQIHQRVRTDPAARSLFNGIHRFIVEDQGALRPEISRTKLRTECKEIAYRVIQRSNAWGGLVAVVFPESLRLSIHPQPSHGEKIGFHLLPTKDSWLTPWHGVLIDDGQHLTLAKRSQAEDMNATLIWRNSRPSHFVAPHTTIEEAAS